MNYNISYPYLLSTWVKSPILKSKIIYIISACILDININLFKKISKEGTVLLACPEKEGYIHYGKLASILRSNEEYIDEVRIITVDGSPHCYTLHASINETEYILGTKIKRKHYVLLDGKELIQIRPESIRVSRYLYLVNKLYEENKEWIERELSKHSLEHKKSRV